MAHLLICECILLVMVLIFNDISAQDNCGESAHLDVSWLNLPPYMFLSEKNGTRILEGAFYEPLQQAVRVCCSSNYKFVYLVMYISYIIALY